jgi:hypothetical protein
MKSTNFRNVMPFSAVRVLWHFEGKYGLSITEQVKQSFYLHHSGYLLSLLFDPNDGHICSSEILLDYIHSIMCQKPVLFRY